MIKGMITQVSRPLHRRLERFGAGELGRVTTAELVTGRLQLARMAGRYQPDRVVVLLGCAALGGCRLPDQADPRRP